MMRFVTKKNTLVFAIILVVITLSSHYLILNTCSSQVIGDFCTDFFVMVRDITYLIVFLLVPILVILPLSASVFNAWKKFAVFAIPIILILVYFISQMKSGGGVGVVGIHPGIIFFPLIYGAYFLTSLGIIVFAWRRSRRTEAQSKTL